MENNAKKGLVKSRPRTQGIIQMALALTSFFVRVKSEKLAEKEIFLLPNDQYTLYKQKVLSEIDTTIPLKSTLKMSTNSSLAYITSYSEAYFGKINSSQLCHQAIALSKESLLLVCNQSVEIYELNQKSTKLVKTKTLPFSFNTSTILLSKLPRISDSIQNLSGVIAGRYEDSDQNDFIVFQNVINGKAQEDRAEFDTRQFGNRQFTGKIRLTQLNNRLVMLHDYNFNLTSSTSDNVLVYDQVDGNIQMLSLDNSNLGHNLKNLISVWASPQNESVYIYIVFTTETDLNPPMHKKRKLEAESTPMLHLSRCIMSDKVELTSCKKIVTHKPVYGGRISLFDSSKEKRSSMKYISFTKHEVEVCDLNQIDLSFSNCLIIQNSLPQMSSIVPDSVDLLSSDQEQLAAEIDRFRQADDQVLILVYSDNQTGKEVISLQIEINNEVNPPQYKIKERLNDQSAELLAYSKTNGFIIRNDSYSVYEEDEKHERMVLRASEMPNSDASLTIMIGGQPKINLKVHKLIQQNLTQVKGPTKWPTFFSFKDELTTLKIPRNALVANNLRYKFIDKSNTVVEEYFYDLTGIDIEMLIIGYKIRKFWPTFEGEQIHGIVILEEIIIPQDPPSGPQNHIAAYFVCEAFKEELYLCSLDNSNAKQAIRKFIMEKDEEIFEVYYNQFSETPGLVVISGIHDPTIINQFTRLSYFRTDKMEFDFSYQKRFANLRPRLSRFVMMGEDFTFWMFSEEEKKFDIYVSKSLHLSEMEQTPTIPFEDLKLYDLDADLFCPTGISFDPSKTDTLDISSSCGKHNSILRLNISDSTNIRPINVVQTSRLASSGQRGNQTVCTFPKEYLVFDYDSSSLYFTTTWTDESISEVDLKSMFNFKTIDQLFCIRGTNYAVIKGKDHFKEDLFAVIEGDSQDDQRKRYVRITKGRGEILHVKGNHEFLFIVTSQTKSYKHALKFFLEGPVYLFRTKPGTQEVNFEVKISSENGEGPSETSETLTSSLKTVFVNHSVELDSKGFQTVKAKQGEYDIIDLLNLTVPIYSIDLAKKIETFENQSRIQVRNAVTLLKPVRISYDFPERIDGIDTFGVGKAYKIIGHKLSSDNRDTTKIYIFDSINKMQGVYDTKNLCDDYSVESALSNERKEGFALAVLTCKDLISYGLHYSIIDYAQRSITNGVLKLDLNLRQLKIKSLGDGRQFILVGFDEVVRRLTLIRLVIEFGQVSIKDMITKPTLISSDIFDYIQINDEHLLIYPNYQKSHLRACKITITNNKIHQTDIEIESDQNKEHELGPISNLECESEENQCLVYTDGTHMSILTLELTGPNTLSIVDKPQRLRRMVEHHDVQQITITKHYVVLKAITTTDNEFLIVYNNQIRRLTQENDTFIWAGISPQVYANSDDPFISNAHFFLKDVTENSNHGLSSGDEGSDKEAFVFIPSRNKSRFVPVKFSNYSLIVKENMTTNDLLNYNLLIKMTAKDEPFKKISLADAFKKDKVNFVHFYIWFILGAIVTLLIILFVVANSKTNLKRNSGSKRQGLLDSNSKKSTIPEFATIGARTTNTQKQEGLIEGMDMDN